MTPLFSVIIPVFNIENYLNQCVESILAQTYAHFEIILVDDGSSDASSKICDSFASQDKRIRVIHKVNEGIVMTRQRGADAAKGDYLIFIDGDDWISPESFQRFAEVITEKAVDIVCCGCYWAYPEENKRRPLQVASGWYDEVRLKKDIFPFLVESENGTYFTPTVWGKAFRRELYVKHQLTNCFVQIGEDLACVHPCIACAKSLYILEDCLYFYRQNPSSVTKNRKSFDWNGPRVIAQHLEKHLLHESTDFEMSIYRNLVHNLFNVAVSQFNRKESYQFITENIAKRISEPYYEEGIRKCRYGVWAWKGRLALFVLKHRLFFLMNLRNKFC